MIYLGRFIPDDLSEVSHEMAIPEGVSQQMTIPEGVSQPGYLSQILGISPDGHLKHLSCPTNSRIPVSDGVSGVIPDRGVSRDDYL